ncbi:MAG TPA: DUF1684 domain-containing protein [Oceanospirillales bacterium]|nr:DUF1684 domain-containing protein [Oceanospirillales bacterium]
MKKIVVLLLLLANMLAAENWQDELESWKQQRLASLSREHGWLSLIGMDWLHKGKNSIGADKTNDIVLPHGAGQLGYFTVEDKSIHFTPSPDSAIKADDKAVTETIEVFMDSSGKPTIFTVDTFQFYVIERGKPALRIKDSQAKTRTEFKGLTYFPANEKFRVKAKFIAYNPAKEVEIINVLGLLSKESAPGKIQFEIDGKTYSLDVLDAGDSYEIIFADKTSGRTTYGPGRFVYVKKQDKDGNITLDFNKAYNPPCAFTDYSTCPLPPPQNRLPVYIEAGEKKYNH